MAGIAIRPLPRSSNIEPQIANGLSLFLLEKGRLYLRSLKRRQIIPGPSVTVVDAEAPIEVRTDEETLGGVIEAPTKDLDLIAIACPEFRMDSISPGSDGFSVMPLTRDILSHINMVIQLGQKNSETTTAPPVDMTRIIVAQVLLLLSPAPDRNEPVLQPNESVEEVAIYIEENWTEEFSLAELAERCGLNPSYFARAFKRLHNRTVFEYIHQIRIEKACILLKRTDRPVIEISGEVGYNNISFFNRCFRRIVGSSPVEYRQSTHS